MIPILNGISTCPFPVAAVALAVPSVLALHPAGTRTSSRQAPASTLGGALRRQRQAETIHPRRFARICRGSCRIPRVQERARDSALGRGGFAPLRHAGALPEDLRHALETGPARARPRVPSHVPEHRLVHRKHRRVPVILGGARGPRPPPPP